MKFCDKLQKIRKENNVTQEQLADKLNVSRQAVSKWESGTAYPDTEKLIQISKIFNTSLDELINDNVDIDRVDNISKKFNFMETFNMICDFISKSVNMFWSMKFGEKLKVLFEMIILVLAIWGLAAISNALIISIIRRIFMFIPNRTLSFIISIFDALIRALWIVLGAIIVIKVFKTRYLDYYIVVTDDSVSEKVIEEPIKELKERKEYKVVIRDPEHSSFNLLKKIGNVIIFFLKILGVCLALPIIITFISLMILFVISLGYTFYGLFFNGISVTLLGMIAFTILVIWFIYNLIFNQKNAYRRMFMIFIISLSLIGIGLGTSALGLRDFEIVSDDKEMNSNQTVTISMKDNLIIPEIIALDSDKYVLSDEYENIKIDVKTLDGMHTDAIVYNDYDDNKVYKIVDIYSGYNGITMFNKAMADFKDKKINTNFDNDSLSFIIDKVYISNDNLTQIRKNYKNLYGE